MKLNWYTLASATVAIAAIVVLWRLFPQRPEALALAGTLATGLVSFLPRLFGGDSSEGAPK